MNHILHIIGGDCAGSSLEKSNIEGDIFVWHDILYDGPRNPGWPTEETLIARSEFIEQQVNGGLDKKQILKTLKEQYQKLETLASYDQIILWFDACLFDQSMLVHILTCLAHLNIKKVELLCVDNFPGIESYHGLGQLSPKQLESVYNQKMTVTDEQFEVAKIADEAFATQNPETLVKLANQTDASIQWIPAAVTRWLQEIPDSETGLGRLETLALEAIQSGNETPADIFKAVAAAETPPQYWGDITLWQKINNLADCQPPFVAIEGPTTHLPQWDCTETINTYRISPK